MTTAVPPIVDFDQLITDLQAKHTAAKQELRARKALSSSHGQSLSEAKQQAELARVRFWELSRSAAGDDEDGATVSVGDVLRNSMPSDDDIAAANDHARKTFAALRVAERQEIIASNAVVRYSRVDCYKERIAAAKKAKESARTVPAAIDARVSVEKLAGNPKPRNGLPLFVSTVEGTIALPVHLQPCYLVGEPLTQLNEVWAMLGELASAGVFGVAPSQKNSRRYRAGVCRDICNHGRLPDDLRTIMGDYADWLDSGCARWPDPSYKAIWLHSSLMRTGRATLLCAETQRDPNAMLNRWMTALCAALPALCKQEPCGKKRSMSDAEEVSSKRIGV